MTLRENRAVVVCVASIATLAVGATAAVGVTREYREVTVHADGLTMSVEGFHRTVEDALDSAGVQVGPHDVVEPTATAALLDGESIQINRAALYTVDGEPQWSPEQTLVDVLEESNAERLTASRHRETVPVVDEDTPARVVVDGQEQPFTLSAGLTIPEVLDDAGVEVGPLDAVSLVMEEDTPAVEVSTQKRVVEVATSEVPFEEVREENDELLVGTEQVVQEGQPGELTVATYRQLRGGEVITEAQISENVTREPVAKIIQVGTREPEPEVPAAPSGGGAGAGGGGGASAPSFSGDAWSALAQCESGGNPSANTGNGFYGMYQFSLPTWQSVGGSGLPSDASAEEQTARAQALQERSGWGQWPGCSSSIGLR